MEMEKPSSTLEWLANMAASAPLKMKFNGHGRGDWKEWRASWEAKLRELMGMKPPRKAMRSQVIEETEMEGFTMVKLVYSSGFGPRVPAYLLLPDVADESHQKPGVLCAHGHSEGNLGKNAVVGITGGEAGKRVIDEHNYDYARSLALKGYVTLAPDWWAFGERLDRSSFSRDPCNVCQSMASWLGYNMLTLDVVDAFLGLDYLENRPEVDPQRLGMVGLSYGGRVATFTSALDDRIKAVVISGALNLYAERIISVGSCGSQVVPGILEWGDIPEVMGLIAPRPLFIERGASDPLLPEEEFRDGYERIERVYRAAGALEGLDKHEFRGGHAFKGTKSIPWLDRWLQVA